MRAKRLLLCLALLAGWAALFSNELGFFVSPDPRVAFEIRDDIRTVERLELWPAANGLFENAGFVPCRDGGWSEAGWCLPPGGRGTLRYALPAQPGSRSLLVRLFFFRKDQRATNRLRVFREGDPVPRLTFENVHFADARLDLSPALAGPGGRVVLSFEGENPTPQPDVLLQQIEVRCFADPLPAPPSLLKMSLAMLALGLCWLPLVSWRRLLPLWAILTLGFALRYYALTRVLWLPLDWDALGYHQLAQKMRLFTEVGFHSAQFGVREPFFPLVVKTMLWVLGDSETHLRLTSLLASVVAIGFLYRVGTKLFNRPLALVGALVMAVTLPLVRESVRGLRLEVELILLLVFVELLFLKTVRSLWLRAGLVGALAGLLVLTRAAYLMTLVPALLFGFLREVPRTSWPAALAALCLMVGMQIPSRWNMYRLHGDAFEDNAEYSRWLANAEFAGHPGFPSKLDVWRDTSLGPRMTYGRYLFTLHTVPELVTGTARGFWKMIRHMDVVAFHGAAARLAGLRLTVLDRGFQAVGVLGLLLAMFRPAARWLPVMFVSLLLPVAFLYDRGLLEPWRHVYHAFPWVLFGFLLSMERVVSWWNRMEVILHV